MAKGNVFSRISVKWKILGVSVLSSLVSLMLMGSYLVYHEVSSASAELTDRIVVQARVLSEHLDAALAFADQEIAEMTLSTAEADAQIDYVALYDLHQQRLFASYSNAARAAAAIPELPPDWRGIKRQDTYLYAVEPVVHAGQEIGLVLVQAELSQLRSRMLGYGGIVLSSLLVIGLLTTLFAARLQRWVTRPLDSLVHTAGQVAESRNYSLRANKSSDDELGFLVDNFNYMLSEMQRSLDERSRAEQALAQNRDQLQEQVREQTEELRLAMQKAEQSAAAKSSFLAHMSHELRTPLNAVLGFSSLLQQTEQPARNRDYLDGIQSSGKALLQLIDDVLDLSRIEAGRTELRPEPVDLRELLGEMQLLFGHRAAEKNLKMRFAVEPTLPHALLLDEVRLRQILVNLIGNALKFTERGQVGVRISGQADDHGRWQLQIAVADTGVGIPPDQQSAVFELFAQRPEQNQARYGGTGLGLGISQGLARLMSGRIELHSEPGAGSTFTLMLSDIDATDARPARDREPSVDAARVFAPATILVVDDVAPNRQLLVDYLRPCGFTLLEADNGERALAAVRETRPDLILMDIRMPVLDGMEATRRLKADPDYSAIPIIAVTASVTGERRAAVAAVCDGYLGKPVSRAELLFELMRHLPYSHGAEGDPDAATTQPELSSLQLPPPLAARLAELRPPFTSVNELEDFAEALAIEGAQCDDQRLIEAAAGLQERLGDLDLAELVRFVEELKSAGAVG